MKLSPGEIDKIIATAKAKGLKVTVRECGALPISTTTSAMQSEGIDDEPGPVPPAKLLPSVYAGSGTWVIGVETRSESNQRGWKGKSGRTQRARRAVSKLLGKTLRSLADYSDHYHRGGLLRVILTRLASRRLDNSNLPASMKAVEDAVAAMIGADDGNARWQAEFGQETSERMGVRIELICE